MLSTPDLSEFTEGQPKFKHYFGRAADFILTGHFFQATYDDNDSVAAWDTLQVDVPIEGLLKTDVVIVNAQLYEADYPIVHSTVTANGVLTLTYYNAKGYLAPPIGNIIDVVALRQEKE